MKKNLSTIITLLLSSTMAIAQTQRDACTSIMAGRLATTDGSVMTSHTCDSWYRTWMSIEPAADYPRDTVMSIYDGLMHTEHSKDMTGVKEKGTIPQAKHTYRFLNTAYPCLNEHQLAMGETTISGRDTLQNKKGMFMIEELARVALQRCTSARSAIQLMGELIKKYGYGDSGECLTIADPKEVWIFEVFGEGPKRIGGVWAAQRIPDDAIAVSANICRIGRIDINDKDNFMASDNVFSVAKSLKLWDGKEDFSFWKAYSGGNYYNEPKNYSVRELYIMQQLAPNSGFNNDMTELPLSVRPEKKVDRETLIHLLGSYYEGTDLSLSNRVDSITVRGGREHKNMKDAMTANPWMRPDEIKMHAAELGDTLMENIRTVSVPWCAYSTVIQLRSWLPDEIGGVAWVSLDNPGQSPRFPIFAGNTELPTMLSICGMHRNREDAALTHFRHANRIASMRWGKARQAMEAKHKYFMKKAARELPFVEDTWKGMTGNEATVFLNGYTSDFFASEIMAWDELTDKYWRQFWAGF